MHGVERLRWSLARRVIPPPFVSRHQEYTIASSADDDVSRPDAFLLDLARRVLERAPTTSLADMPTRTSAQRAFLDVWPGEHYRTLEAIVHALAPRVVVEVGTHEGLSATCMARALPPGGRIVTFDLVPSSTYPGDLLTGAADARIEQRIADMSDPAVVREHADLLRSADLLFVDAAKDGRMEPALWRALGEVGLKPSCVSVWDDIRMWPMLAFWRGIRAPKLDLTSFGHWAGTGIVHGWG